MIARAIKCLIGTFITLFSIQVVASDTIKITVVTKEANAIAIGFTVDNKESGSLGKTFTGRGPINKEYHFGFKKDSLFGDNIYCGSLTLTQDTTVVLIIQDNKCLNMPV